MEETNKIIILSKEDVQKFKESNDKLEFYTQKPEMKWGFIIVTAPWCGHCQDFQPDIEFLAKHLSEHQVYFFKLNSEDDETHDILDKLNVNGYPSIFNLKPIENGKCLIEEWTENSRSVETFLNFLSQ